MHCCSDEIFAAMTVIPFLGIYGRRLSVWWHARAKLKAACACESMHGKKDEE